jgi:polysaccharide chain length determinant protein (PEP-CTERM system associated)
MRIGLTSTQDFLALLVRRKWWIAASFLALSSATALLTYFLPGIFVSEALILVQPRDVPEKFVMDLIAGSTQERLSTIEQTLRSRTNLIQILREFEDRLPEFKALDMDARVERLNSQIQIKFQLEEGRAKEALTSFRMSYQNQNPALAQQIASKLTTLFIEQDHRVRENQVFGTTEFLSTELQKVTEQLNASDKQLAELKSSNQFEMPAQLEANLRTLDRLTLQRQSNGEALDRNAALRLNLERQIAETPEVLGQTSLVAPGGGPAPATALDPRIEEYRKAKSEYEEAAAIFTSKHPQVQSLKARLERLAAQLPSNAAAGGATVAAAAKDITTTNSIVPNPLYQKLVDQLREVKTESEILLKEKTYIESEIQKYSRRVENTPQSEERLADVLRRNATLQKQADELKSKLAEAQLAQSLEGRQKGSQFVVIDSANYPLRPTKPNKLLVLIGGIMASLAVAVGFAVALDVARQRVWTQTEIEAFWGTPVLIEIPEILTDSSVAVQRKRKFIFTLSSVGATAAYGVCLYLMYMKHISILQRLDPVLQKLVYK